VIASILSIVVMAVTAQATCFPDGDGNSVTDPYDDYISKKNDETDTDRYSLENPCDPDIDENGFVTDRNSMRGFPHRC
jgi:hypothetical protein